MALSEQAKTALVNAYARRGAEVRADGQVADELERAGMIGRQYGLTEKGIVERARIFNARLDEAF